MQNTVKTYYMQVDRLPLLYRHKMVFNKKFKQCQFSYRFIACFQRITLLYSMPLSLLTGKTIYQPITTHKGLFFFKTLTFLILYYEYDCNIVCHKNFLTVHSLVYKPGYHDTTLLHQTTIKPLYCCFVINESLYLQVNINFFTLPLHFLCY